MPAQKKPLVLPTSANVAARRHKRRAQGLCAEAGCDQRSGKRFRCARHAEASANRVRRHRENARKLERADRR